MPITASRFQFVLEITKSALKVADQTRQTLFNIQDDLKTLRSEENELERMSIIATILEQIDVGVRTNILESHREEFYREAARFDESSRKNRKRNLMKQIQRRGIKALEQEKEFLLGKGETEIETEASPKTKLRKMTAEQMRVDYEEYLEATHQDEEETNEENEIKENETETENHNETERTEEDPLYPDESYYIRPKKKEA